MLINEFQFLLEIRSGDGRVLGERPVEPNWSPAAEWARFAWWRRSPGSDEAFGADAIIAPVPKKAAGLPFASGFRVTLDSAGQALDCSDFPITYFSVQARAISTEMVAAGLLKAGDTYLYQLLAYPRERAKGTPPARPKFRVVDVVQAPRLKRASLSTLTSVAAPFGEPAMGDMPVFIPQEILEEISALTEQAGAVETGGILVGHLCADGSVPDVGVQVTAQIPARHAQGELGKLTFTAETWAAVRAALALRRSEEQILGWWHSHPAFAWCSPTCPPERRRTCPYMQNFFSQDDTCLHETVFPSAFHTALVVTNTNQTREGLQLAMFAWNRGAISQRGFYILNPDRPWRRVNATLQEGTSHASPCK